MTFGSVLALLAILLVVYLLDGGSLGELLDEAPTSPEQPSTPGQSVETENLAGFANGAVQVYFTRPRYPETAAGRVGGLDETLAADIDRAQETVDLAFFDLDLPVVAEALHRADERGVDVRVVIDGENLAAPEVADLAGALQEAGIPITFDERSAFMHNKFVVLDDSVVWTGSWNATINDTFRNNNNMLRFDDSRVADNYLQKFELLFAGQGGPTNPASIRYPAVELGPFTVETAFAPDSDITGRVIQAIDEAETSVDLLAFTITQDDIADALLDAHDRGVAIRGVVERRNAEGTGSELPRLQAAGLDVLTDGNCYIMHNKVIIVDGQTVITGSFNWSQSAQDSNDENAVVVHNGWLAQRYAEEFGRIYEQARNPTTCGG